MRYSMIVYDPEDLTVDTYTNIGPYQLTSKSRDHYKFEHTNSALSLYFDKDRNTIKTSDGVIAWQAHPKLINTVVYAMIPESSAIFNAPELILRVNRYEEQILKFVHNHIFP